MSNLETYTLQFPGLVLELSTESYPEHADPDMLGDSRWTFQRADLERAGLLDAEEPFLFVQRSRGGDVWEKPLAQALREDTEDEDEPLPEDVESGNLDACIVALRAIMEAAEERHTHEDGAEPWTVRVGWEGAASVFWIFHDITHALEDVEHVAGGGEVHVGDGASGASGAYAEDRANLEGARRAVRAGVDTGEVLAELAGLADAFRSRFGEDSTALADFLDGHTGDDDGAQAYADTVEEHASDVLDASEPGEDLDRILERAWEYVDGSAPYSGADCAAVLVHASDTERGADYVDPESDAESQLRARAFGALLGDVEQRIRERFEDGTDTAPALACRVCADMLRAEDSPACPDCADGLEDEEREELERELDEERAELRAETADTDAPTPDEDARTVHLSVFARVGRFAACGSPIAGLADLTEDVERVTCEDCAGRIVRAVEEPAPSPLGMPGEECMGCGADLEGADVDAHACPDASA